MSIQDIFTQTEQKMIRELCNHSGFNQQEILGLAIMCLHDTKPWPIDINMTKVKAVRNALAESSGMSLEKWCEWNGYSISMAKVTLDLIEKGGYPKRPRSRRLLEQLERDTKVVLTNQESSSWGE